MLSSFVFSFKNFKKSLNTEIYLAVKNSSRKFYFIFIIQFSRGVFKIFCKTLHLRYLIGFLIRLYFTQFLCLCVSTLKLIQSSIIFSFRPRRFLENICVINPGYCFWGTGFCKQNWITVEVDEYIEQGDCLRRVPKIDNRIKIRTNCDCKMFRKD